ncbi:MAG: hypothetical protein K5841_07700 [Fretibacterium sp.]|nr:hypothetical protein [Fretibacterium sp.]
MIRYDCVQDIHIAELACAVPRQHVASYDRVAHLMTEKAAKRRSRETGFCSLRVAPDELMTSDLFEASALQILNDDNRRDIGALIFVTQYPDYICPATSHDLQHRLGLENDVLCLDINEGCSGFITGLYVAAVLSRQMQKKVLMGCGDTCAKGQEPDDAATRFIFGDAAAAALVEPGTDNVPFAFASYGDRANTIMLTKSSMNPRRGDCHTFDSIEIINFAANEAHDVIVDFLDRERLAKTDVSLYACHQANKIILNGLADKLGVSYEQLPFLAGETGNTSSASIPLELSSFGDGNPVLKKTLCCGFGVGLSVGVCLADFTRTRIHKDIEV